MLILKIVILSFTILSVYGFETTKYGRRGTARIMTGLFSIQEESSSSIQLDNTKRDRVTWYTGRDLKNAACYDRNGLAPYHAQAEHLVGAMAMYDFEECYQCMRITNNDYPWMQVTVKIVDKCEACTIGNAIDLTPGAFEKLSLEGDLDIGVLDISFYPVNCPYNDFIPKLAMR